MSSNQPAKPPPRGCIVEVGATETVGPCGSLGCKCVQYKGRCDCLERCRLAELAASASSSLSSTTTPEGLLAPSSTSASAANKALEVAAELAAAVRTTGVEICGCNDYECKCPPNCECLATRCPCCGGSGKITTTAAEKFKQQEEEEEEEEKEAGGGDSGMMVL